jgi:hypothetical protein
MSELLHDFPELPLMVVVLLAALLFRTARRVLTIAIIGFVVAVLLGVMVRGMLEVVVPMLPDAFHRVGSGLSRSAR